MLQCTIRLLGLLDELNAAFEEDWLRQMLTLKFVRNFHHLFIYVITICFLQSCCLILLELTNSHIIEPHPPETIMSIFSGFKYLKSLPKHTDSLQESKPFWFICLQASFFSFKCFFQCHIQFNTNVHANLQSGKNMLGWLFFI